MTKVRGTKRWGTYFSFAASLFWVEHAASLFWVEHAASLFWVEHAASLFWVEHAAREWELNNFPKPRSRLEVVRLEVGSQCHTVRGGFGGTNFLLGCATKTP